MSICGIYQVVQYLSRCFHFLKIVLLHYQHGYWIISRLPCPKNMHGRCSMIFFTTNLAEKYPHAILPQVYQRQYPNKCVNITLSLGYVDKHSICLTVMIGTSAMDLSALYSRVKMVTRLMHRAINPAKKKWITHS